MEWAGTPLPEANPMSPTASKGQRALGLRLGAQGQRGGACGSSAGVNVAPGPGAVARTHIHCTLFFDFFLMRWMPSSTLVMS